VRREAPLRAILNRFRLGGELRPLVCLVATVASALVLTGLGVFGGWVYGMTRSDPMRRMPIYGDVRDDHIVAGLLGAGVVWVILLYWIWRPAIAIRRHALRSGRAHLRWRTPLLTTGGLLAAITIASYAVHRQPWDDVEWAVTGLTLLAGGIALIAWLPIVFGVEQGGPLRGPDGQVNVHCTQCGYSMVGLRETVCPECGRQYTIDELIREQR